MHHACGSEGVWLEFGVGRCAGLREAGAVSLAWHFEKQCEWLLTSEVMLRGGVCVVVRHGS